MLLNILLGLLIVVGVALTGLVLLQRSEGGALGMGGGGGQLVSARGAANFLTRSTWIIASAFFVLALSITIILGRQSGSGSLTDNLKIESLDPSKMAADQKAMIEQMKAKQEAEKALPPKTAPTSGPIPGGFGAPAPAPTGGGLSPFAPVAPTSAPKAPLAAPKAAAPQVAASKAAAPKADAPAALPIIPAPSGQ